RRDRAAREAHGPRRRDHQRRQGCRQGQDRGLAGGRHQGRADAGRDGQDPGFLVVGSRERRRRTRRPWSEARATRSPAAGASATDMEKMMLERTFSIVKPDAVAANKIGEVVALLEAGGLRVVAQKMVRLSTAQAEQFYAVHRERGFFKDLVRFMTEGPVVV